MKMFNTFDDVLEGEALAMSFGYFDGVHLGHRKIIEEEDLRLKNCVVTFDRHPLEVINRDIVPKKLMTMEEKKDYLESLGIDYLFVLHFNSRFMNLTADEFIDMILESVNLKKMKVGFNYHFGRNGSGNVDVLREKALEKGFELKVVDEFKIGETTVSSTAIRKFISEGNIKKANEFLGHPYSFKGIVKVGKRLGGRIGIPTVNLSVDSSKVLPRKGVYVSRILVGDEVFYGISNIGNNPTFREEIKVETHIFDFDRDIYGEEITVELLEFEREERVFESLEDMISTINKSIAFGKKYIENMEETFK